MGVISAIGNSVAENRGALSEGKCGITPLEFIDSKFTGKLPCGEIKITTETFKQRLGAQEKRRHKNLLAGITCFYRSGNRCPII
jgi:3-oxoacyl-[acyl-carrier-protein] synthase-1